MRRICALIRTYLLPLYLLHMLVMGDLKYIGKAPETCITLGVLVSAL